MLKSLPPWVLLLATATVAPAVASAQPRYRVVQSENFRRDPRPNGRLLATVASGSELPGGETRSGWVQITLDGWIWSASIRSTATDGFDAEVSATGGENLRDAPNGTIVARLGQGFLMAVVERDDNWVRVRRSGWMWGRSLERVDVAPEPAAAEPPPATVPSAEELNEYTVTATDAALHPVPDGDTVGTVTTGMPVRVVERAGPWVRVRLDGWVREEDIRPASPDILVGVNAAEIRARPEDFRGRTIQWIVQYISLRTADALRQELPEGQRYMLARGPVPEAGFLYVALNAEQAEAIGRLTPLAQVVITAVVRVPRSRYLGHPVLELVEFSLRSP